MAYLRESHLAVSLFLLVQQCSGDEGVTFSIDDRVEEYAYTLAKNERNYVTWWDTKGKHPKLKEDYPRYKKYKVTTTAGAMKFSQPRKEYVTSKTIFSHHFENHLQTPSKVFMNKKIEHKRTSTWNIESSFNRESEYFIQFSFPKNLISLGASYKDSSTEKSASGGTTTDVEVFAIGKNVTVVPGTSLKVTWTISEYVQVQPWRAEVTSRGWFAVYYYYKRLYKYLWFHPVCNLQHKSLVSNCSTENEDGGYVTFTATGTFTGVKNTEIKVNTVETDLKVYGGERPQLNNTICQ